jgi:dipeptidyl aminopeptidase/acylaminoacyl peptidase
MESPLILAPHAYPPPWRDIEVYIRNSPLAFAGNVTTPLLIIHGDLDHVPIEQGEEFYNALRRQNKRARFVRYFGETNELKSPANIRDANNKIVEWFDQFLSPNRK